MVLNQIEEMLLVLLRAALDEGRAVEGARFTEVPAEDWQACYRLAVKQGVMALAWDGVRKLPADVQPPKALRLAWAVAVERYEKRYSRYCRTLAELSAFYAVHGIVTVQLKGAGLSAYYPVPCHREGGDIDIFTCSANLDVLSDKDANRLADRLMEEQGMAVDYEHTKKHSMFYYKGIPVENHKTFVNAEMYRVAVQTDRLLKGLLQPVEAELDRGHRILVPSPAFNTVFLAFHAAQHYARGLALHHLCDWACLLCKQGLHIPDEVTDVRFRNMILALTQLCNRYLGTSVEVCGGEELAEEVLQEILRPRYTKVVPAKSKWGILVYKTRRMLYIHRRCNSVLRISLARWVADSILLHLRFPHTVFQTDGK